MTERWQQQQLNGATWDVLKPMLIAGALATGFAVLFSCKPAHAVVTCDQRGCSDWKGASVQKQARISQTVDANGNGVVIGRRPPGCPRAYCGCGASLYIFGKIKPELNLAASWLKFPRTSPAPGMVAARRGHVMVLLSHVEGNDWLVHDSNSGGGLTRRHVRSIAPYRIVNPHGAYAER